MRIAIAIENFDPEAGGNERSTAQIAEALRDRGHAVTILTGASPGRVAIEGVEVRAMTRGKSSSVLRLLRFARWAGAQLQRGGFDASLSVTMAVAAQVLQPRGGTVRETLARNIAMRRSPSSRFFKRIALALNPKQQALLMLERRTLASPRVGRVVAVSQYVTEQLANHYQVGDDRIELIPNASVMPAPDPDTLAKWRGQVRQAFGIPEEATVFLFAAQNPRLKGFGTLVPALRRLVDRGLEPVVLLAGKFGYGHQAWVAELGLRDHVRFVGPTRSMPRLYAAADATVLPTFYDPASKVVIESLMMGRPAISTGSNGASDFIEPEVGRPRGRVIDDAADVDALADAMAELCDPVIRAACAAAIDPRLADELSMARHVDRLESVLRDAAAAYVPTAS